MMAGPNKVACVEIGGIPISLATSNQTFYDLLIQRYRGFLSTASAEFKLEFDIAEAGSNSGDDVRVSRDGMEWKIDRGDFSARWDPRTGTGLVRQNANPYALDSVLRILHSLILAERGGFLLHAASAIREGRAYLFAGVSGAGKTTMTRLAPPDVTLLTDEVSYVLPITKAVMGGAASASGYQAFGTPFAGELAKPGENTKAQIAALFFLEQGPANHIDKLAPTEAVRRLMRNILFFAEDANLVEKVMASACDFAERVPVRRLTFYPDFTVWDEVRRFARNPQEERSGHDRVYEGISSHA
jgi:hypothetical protein